MYKRRINPIRRMNSIIVRLIYGIWQGKREGKENKVDIITLCVISGCCFTRYESPRRVGALNCHVKTSVSGCGRQRLLLLSFRYLLLLLLFSPFLYLFLSLFQYPSLLLFYQPDMEALTQIALNPKYHDALTILKGFRNGVVYGARIRFPHALVMAFLFKSGS